MKAFVLIIAVLATAVFAQTALDPTQIGAYPTYPYYLPVSCGRSSTPVVLEEKSLLDGGFVAMVKATASCSSSGRGSKPRIYLACWRVTFAEDRYSILDREEVLYAAWSLGQSGYSCPAL